MSDSYSRPQTRESVESAKKWLEYESFEYESRLDTALVSTALTAHPFIIAQGARNYCYHRYNGNGISTKEIPAAGSFVFASGERRG